MEKRGAKRKRWIALAVVVAASAMVIVWGMRCSPETARVVSRDNAQPSAPRLNLRNAPEQAALPAPQSNGGSNAVSTEAPKSYREAVRRRDLKRLEERWRGEPEGRDWTHKVEQRLLDELRKNEIPGKLEQVDCRRTLCRTQIAFDDADDAAKINAIVHDTAWYSDLRLIDGQRAVVTGYLGAPGVDLRDITDDPPAR